MKTKAKPREGYKFCSLCKEEKPIATGFTMRPGGRLVQSRCRGCNLKKAQERNLRIKKEKQESEENSGLPPFKWEAVIPTPDWRGDGFNWNPGEPIATVKIRYNGLGYRTITTKLGAA